MKKLSKHFKKIILFSTIILLILIIIAFFWEEKFTKEKWLNNPDERTVIVNNLLSKHKLIGMSEKEIINLLGDPTYSENDILYYDLGPERSFIQMDHEFLHIKISEDAVVSATIYQH